MNPKTRVSVFALLAILIIPQVSFGQILKRCRTNAAGQTVCTDQFSSSALPVQGFAVGSRDSDGAVITSIGVAAVPTVPALPSAASSSATPPAMEGRKERKTSRAAILEALDKAKAAGTIGDEQVRAIKLATLSPRMMSRIENLIVERAQSEGYALPTDADGDVIMAAVDWAAIADFITKIAPVIFKLIELFL